MISYLLNFTLCSGLLLLGYHLLLKNKTMFVFNRFYLLFSIAFSLSVPFAVTTYTLPVKNVQPVTHEIQILKYNDRSGATDQKLAVTTDDKKPESPQLNYWPYILIGAFSIISLMLLVRFAYNLMQLRKSIMGKQQIHFNGAKLILINENQTPHTFLNYIFLNRENHLKGRIDNHILKHELTHARQYHSIDVIFIELIQIFCWFNPFIWAYKKAMQLNHEFIADAVVLENESNIVNYQHLLLSNLGYNRAFTITSQFNYSLTKKRLIMMTKNTSALTAILAKLAMVPFVAAAFLLFSTKADANNYPAAASHARNSGIDTAKKIPSNVIARFAPPTIRPDYPCTKEGVSAADMKQYTDIASKYLGPGRGRRHHLTQADYTTLVTIFKRMSRSQQKDQLLGFNYQTPPLPLVRPTGGQLSEWKNPKMYGLWIDGKHVANTELDKYQADDFNQVFVSKLMKTAINYKNYKYQVDLMTTEYYGNYVNEENKRKYESIPYFGYYKGYDNTK